MTTIAKTKRRVRGKPATSKRRDTSPTRPFTVTSGELRFRFRPEEIGFSVQCLNVPEAISQGDTFEEALNNAHEAVAFAKECLADIAKEK